MFFKNIPYTLSQKDEEQINDFAENSHSTHYNPNNRDKSSKKIHIFQGKGAEIAFHAMAKIQGIEISDVNFTINDEFGGDGGIDFPNANNKTVGVKSNYAGKPHYSQVVMGYSKHLACEIYVLLVSGINDNKYNYIGNLSRKYIIDNNLLKYESRYSYYYIEKRYFEEPRIHVEF